MRGSGKGGLKPSLALDTNIVQDNVPQEIVPGIFIGSIHAAFNQEALARNGITHILNASRLPATFPRQFTYLSIDLRDKAEANMLSCIPASNIFIEAGVDAGGVLVHCFGGRSRSAAFVAAFLMSSRNWSFDKAMSVIYAARPIASINQGFVMQLNAYMFTNYDIYEAQQLLLKNRLRGLHELRRSGNDSANLFRTQQANGNNNGSHAGTYAGGGNQDSSNLSQMNGSSHGNMTMNAGIKSSDNNHGDSFSNIQHVLHTNSGAKQQGSGSSDDNTTSGESTSPNSHRQKRERENQGVSPRREDELMNIVDAKEHAQSTGSAADGSSGSVNTKEAATRPRSTTGRPPVRSLGPGLPVSEGSAPNCRLTRPGSTSVRVIPPLRGLERRYCCTDCGHSLFALASVIRNHRDVYGNLEMEVLEGEAKLTVANGMDTSTDSANRGSFTSDGGASDGRDSTGSAGAPPNKIGCKSDGTPYHSRDQVAPHHSVLHHDGEAYHGSHSHPTGHVHFSEAADDGAESMVPACSPRGAAGPSGFGKPFTTAPLSSKNSQAKSFSFDSFGDAASSLGGTSNGAGSYSDSYEYKAPGKTDSKSTDHMDVSSTPNLDRHTHASSSGSQSRSSLRGHTLALQAEGSGSVPLGHPGSGAVPRGLQLALQKGYERPQSAEKRRWLARVSLLNADSKESMSVHPPVPDAKTSQLAAQDADMVDLIDNSSNSLLFLEYLSWMGESPLYSERDEGGLACPGCLRSIGYWKWLPADISHGTLGGNESKGLEMYVADSKGADPGAVETSIPIFVALRSRIQLQAMTLDNTPSATPRTNESTPRGNTPR